jgi:hypothetical protein
MLGRGRSRAAFSYQLSAISFQLSAVSGQPEDSTTTRICRDLLWLTADS